MTFTGIIAALVRILDFHGLTGIVWTELLLVGLAFVWSRTIRAIVAPEKMLISWAELVGVECVVIVGSFNRGREQLSLLLIEVFGRQHELF